ncbi:hypothetical protein B0H15DRAFT_930018 [Mycena belliarum]|uniref:RING-CH-type domain-containing protein n=1 Tax=Mycena belliarum TaxID=1033014 RepID=A0AAD6XQG8_9AGAR|nr:hypothetical protein B0H15DRAFT_930018 [Mycena belliae]
MDYMDTIPTLDDLRVKSCFICLEEEPAHALDKTNPWVHPCPNCALLAHDKCLIRWIATLPVKRHPTRRAPANTVLVPDAFKCPRCGRQYELMSSRLPRGHLLGALYVKLYMIVFELGKAVSSLVGIFTLQSIPLALSVQARAVVLSGMFLYEVLFLKSYLGPHMFSLLLTGEPEDLLQQLFILVPIIPFRLLLPGSVPQWIVPLYIAFPPVVSTLLSLATPATTLEPHRTPHSTWPPAAAWLSLDTTYPMISTWPLSPALLGLVLVPLIRPVYSRLFSRFQTWVLGSSPPPRQRRYLTERVVGVFSFSRRRPPPGNLAGDRPAPPAVEVQDDDPPPLAIADEIIRKDQASFTHDLVHAISTIAVPQLFGNLLWVASGYSGYLRRFLGLRQPRRLLTAGISSYYPNWIAMDLQHKALAVSQAVGGLLLGGSWIWSEVDPVWWRNSLGYGMFVIAKDCLELYRLRLQKQEVQSRTIKSRDFTGVDVSELDLIAPERFT